MYLIAIDYSHSNKNPKDLFSIIIIYDRDYHTIKEILNNKLDVKQWKKLGKRKTTYIVKLERHITGRKKLICLKDLCIRLRSYKDFEDLLKENSQFLFKAKFIFIDDTLLKNKKYNLILGKYNLKNLIEESKVKNTKKTYYPLMLLADNIANLSRTKKTYKWK